MTWVREDGRRPRRRQDARAIPRDRQDGADEEGAARPGDLVDLLDDSSNVWREAIVTEVSAADPSTASVRVLFETREEQRLVDLRDAQRVRPYGSECFTPVSGPERLKPGAFVDVLNCHPARDGYCQARVVQVGTNLWVRVALEGDAGVENMPPAMVWPFGSYTFPADHPDNVARVRFLDERYDGPGRLPLRELPGARRRQRRGFGARDARLRPGSGRAVAGRRARDDDVWMRGYDNEGGENDGIWYDEDEDEDDYGAQVESKDDMLSRKRRQRDIGAAGPRFERYVQALRERGLRVASMEGDGNCLFRSVSHQVYGTPEYHLLVRQNCVDYMQSERAYFEPFVVGGAAGFEQYIARKRQDGVWGDDIELQAMCEIYDRPAQVYAYDGVAGARQLRTFHEDDRRRPPMRLSFYGGGHYDSLIGSGFEDAVLREEPGRLEAQRIALSRARRSGLHADGALFAGLSENQLLAQTIVDDAIKASRHQYMAVDQDLDSVLAQSLEDAEASDSARLDSALQESMETAGLVEQEEQQAIKASDVAATDQEALEVALRMSQEDAPPELSEMEQLEQLELAEALRLSRAEEQLDAPVELARVGPAVDEDDELQRAIAESLKSS